MTDLGDHYAGRLQAAEDRADLLAHDLAEARARADGYVDLIHAAVLHHLTAHPTCDHWRTP